jgi:hypothetical protein
MAPPPLASAAPARKGGLLQEFATSGLSVATATTVTNPLGALLAQLVDEMAAGGVHLRHVGRFESQPTT